jgi:phosphatidylserine/phosphatidylglycerophosphate/cardiolipin synthase-like enzyme
MAFTDFSPSLKAADAQVFFSPHGGATEAAVREIGKAKREILVQAYSFSSVPIATSLVLAKNRGVKIEVILDKSNLKEGYSSMDFLEHAGIPIYLDNRVKIAHSKVMIIDGEEVITGSFNFTKAAEYSNSENLIILKSDPALIAKYLKNFYWRLALSLQPPVQALPN